VGEPAIVDHPELTDPPPRHLHSALCPACEGNRYTCRDDQPVICTVCHGDGLARRQLAAVADDARLSVDWLT
jgi:hypothetical protein